MECQRFQNIYFSPDSSIGQFCDDLNEIVRQGICYDIFEIQNTKELWLVSNKVIAMNNDKTLCGCFGMYPRFVAVILNSARPINFFVLCNEELKYENYIEKCTGDKECSGFYKSHTGLFFSKYRIKAKKIYYVWSKTISETAIWINVRSEWLERNTVRLSSLRSSNS